MIYCRRNYDIISYSDEIAFYNGVAESGDDGSEGK